MNTTSEVILKLSFRISIQDILQNSENKKVASLVQALQVQQNVFLR